MIDLMLKYARDEPVAHQITLGSLDIEELDLHFLRPFNHRNLIRIGYATLPRLAGFLRSVNNSRVDHGHELFIHQLWMVPVDTVTHHKETKVRSYLRGRTRYRLFMPETLHVTEGSLTIINHLIHLFCERENHRLTNLGQQGVPVFEEFIGCSFCGH